MSAQTDPIELAIFKSAFHSIAEEMGAALRRTSFSPNIKERRDYSSAVFDKDGNVIAMGDDMPVHLGSMPMSVRAALDALTLEPGDIAILNDPYAGGTHLPDITLVMPVFAGSEAQPAFFVANRAHHADVGGMYPGSMGPCREIFQEGLRIPPVKLYVAGRMNDGVFRLILNNVRTPGERDGDLTAQIGACRIGAERVLSLVEKYGIARVQANITALLDHSERLMRAELRQLPRGEFSAEDALDDDGISNARIPIRVTLITDPGRGEIRVDFSESSPQVTGSVNAVHAITYSATFYVLRCLLPPEAAPTAGLMRPVSIITKPGTVVNARPPAPVAGGNVETSQRITDVLMRAFAKTLPDRVPAASSGTMNNVTIGGIDPRNSQPYTYYETVAGGAGACPGSHGISGVHTHMTNSSNTPIEALEFAYPFRVHRYAYRKGSGGAGQFRGGDGLIREIEILGPAQITLLADRRLTAPYGLSGGEDGKQGRSVLTNETGEEKTLPGKCSITAKAGSCIRIESPGGGGWGKSKP
ncbi:MAG: hydantoinase B/oxoprolinase family protein [Bryobacteraceae bacterium]